MLIKKYKYLDLPRNKVKCGNYISLQKRTDVSVQVKWPMKESYLELSVLLQKKDEDGDIDMEYEIGFLVTFPINSIPSGGPDFSALAVSGCSIWDAVDVSLQQLVTNITKKLSIFFKSPNATVRGVEPNEVVIFSLEIGHEVIEGESIAEKLGGFLTFREQKI